MPFETKPSSPHLCIHTKIINDLNINKRQANAIGVRPPSSLDVHGWARNLVNTLRPVLKRVVPINHPCQQSFVSSKRLGRKGENTHNLV